MGSGAWKCVLNEANNKCSERKREIDKKQLLFVQQIHFILILYLFHLFHNDTVHAGKSAIHPIMVKTPDEMYDSNLNVNVDMMFGYTNYVRLNFTIFKLSNLVFIYRFRFDLFCIYSKKEGVKKSLHFIFRSVSSWFGVMFKIHRGLTIF